MAPHPATLIQNKRNYSRIVFAILLLFTALTNLLYLKNELWQDELYSLDNFILVPVGKTLTDYHDNNNHILFSLLSNLYLKAIGISNLSQIQKTPELIRILPYTFTLLTVACFYRMSCKVFGLLPATIASILLVTSLQTYTFGTQVRGYALEMLLFTLQFLWILLYRQRPSTKLLYLITLTGFLALINLPSILYVEATLFLLLSISAFRKSGSGNQVNLKVLVTRKLFQSGDGKLLLSLTACFILTFLFFLTRREEIAKNSIFYPVGNSLFELIKQPFAVFYHFIDFRYHILALLTWSSFMIYRKKVDYRFPYFLAGTFMLPFLFFALHNPMIMPRIWIVLLPVFCLLVGQWSTPIFITYKKWLFPFAVLNVITLAVSLYFLHQSQVRANEENEIALNLRYQYHLYGFNPNAVLQTAISIAGKDGAKIKIEENFLAGIRFYKRYWPLDSLNEANKNSQKLFLITDRTLSPEDFSKQHLSMTEQGEDNHRNFYKWYLLNESATGDHH